MAEYRGECGHSYTPEELILQWQRLAIQRTEERDALKLALAQLEWVRVKADALARGCEKYRAAVEDPQHAVTEEEYEENTALWMELKSALRELLAALKEPHDTR